MWPWQGGLPPGMSGGGGGGIGGSTGGADNAALRADGAGGVTLQASPLLIGDVGDLSNHLRARKANAGGTTLTATDSGKTVSITAGSGDDDVNLPATPSPGTWYTIVIVGTDRLTIHAQGSHVIYNGASASTAGGSINSNVKGSRLTIEYVATNVWACASTGTWTLA